MKKKIKTKKFNLYSLLILFVVLILSVGYSAFNQNLSISNVIAHFRLNEEIRITNISVESSSGNAISESEEYSESQIITSIHLPKAESTVTYKIEITNFESTEMGILNITGLPDNLDYTISNYKLEEKICNTNNECSLGIKKEIYLTIKYKNNKFDSNDVDNKYNLNLTFDFRAFHSVSYTAFNNSTQYKSYVMDGATYTETFTEEVEDIKVKMGDISISNFTFDGRKISISNVTDDLEIRRLGEAILLTGIELNHIIKNIQYAPEGDIHEYYSVEANRTEDRTIKKIVFGKKTEYMSEVGDAIPQAVDGTRTGTISLYRITDTDGLLIIYILSDEGNFILNSDASWMFDKLYALEEIINLHLVDTSQVIYMQDMFSDCATIKNIDLSNFNTTNVTDMTGMFSKTSSLEYLDLSSFNIPNLKNVTNMFSDSVVKKIYVSGKWNIPSTVEDDTNMFSGCKNLVGGNGTVFDSTKTGSDMAIIDGTTSGYLTGSYKFNTGLNVNHAIKGIPVANRETWDMYSRFTNTDVTTITIGKTRDYQELVSGYTGEAVDNYLSGAIKVYRVKNSDNSYSVYILSNSGTFIANEDASWMFDKLIMLQSINNLELVNTSNVTTMRDMFCDCHSLSTLNLLGFDTSNVQNMEGMFARVYSLKILDLSSFDTSKTTNITYMLYLGIGTDTHESFINVIPALTTVYVSDLWTNANMIDTGVFANNVNLVGGAGTIYNPSFLTTAYARADTPENPGYFTLK